MSVAETAGAGHEDTGRPVPLGASSGLLPCLILWQHFLETPRGRSPAGSSRHPLPTTAPSLHAAPVVPAETGTTCPKSRSERANSAPDRGLTSCSVRVFFFPESSTHHGFGDWFHGINSPSASLCSLVQWVQELFCLLPVRTRQGWQSLWREQEPRGW